MGSKTTARIVSAGKLVASVLLEVSIAAMAMIGVLASVFLLRSGNPRPTPEPDVTAVPSPVKGSGQDGAKIPGEESSPAEAGAAGSVQAETGPGRSGGGDLPASNPAAVDTANPWATFWSGAALALLVNIAIVVVYAINPPANWSGLGDIALIYLFLASPGLSIAGLGLYLVWRRKNGWVAYRLSRRDYWGTLVQLLPGTAIAALGNMLPLMSPLMTSWGSVSSWVSLACGTIVSVLLVRNFEEPASQPSVATSQ